MRKTKEKYQHVLVALDLSKASHEVVERAMQIQKCHGAEMSLVHIVEPIPTYGYLEVVEVEQSCTKQAGKDLAKFGKKMNIPQERQFVGKGIVKNEILKLVEKMDIDLIVMGSHGVHGLSRLLGSAATAVLHAAVCDVLVVRLTD